MITARFSGIHAVCNCILASRRQHTGQSVGLGLETLQVLHSRGGTLARFVEPAIVRDWGIRGHDVSPSLLCSSPHLGCHCCSKDHTETFFTVFHAGPNFEKSSGGPVVGKHLRLLVVEMASDENVCSTTGIGLPLFQPSHWPSMMNSVQCSATPHTIFRGAANHQDVIIPSRNSFRSCQVRWQPRDRRVHTCAIRIDRRQHLEQAWRRQQSEEEVLLAEEGAGFCPLDCITEVRNMRHLDALVEAAGPRVLVIAFYSRSCGTCKTMLAHFADLCREASMQRSGICFLKHNLRDEFDNLTDIARLYRTSRPAFVFVVGGAQVRRVDILDARQFPTAIQRLLSWQRTRLAATVQEMLFRNTPSARR